MSRIHTCRFNKYFDLRITNKLATVDLLRDNSKD